MNIVNIPPIDIKMATAVSAAIRRELNYFNTVEELKKTEYTETKLLLEGFWASLNKAIAESEPQDEKDGEVEE